MNYKKISYNNNSDHENNINLWFFNAQSRFGISWVNVNVEFVFIIFSVTHVSTLQLSIKGKWENKNITQHEIIECFCRKLGQIAR